VSTETSVTCFSCSKENGEDLPLRELVWSVPGWRVALAFNSSLPGWLVLVPTRHVESLDELNDEETSVLGGLMRDVTKALKTVTGCSKTYVMLLAEAPGFTHVHFHVVPRMHDLPEERRGRRIFAYLKEEPLTSDQFDEVAMQLRAALLDIEPRT
jgi:diadenosine tetraphosphate (Ap4A) HIT family hydrolase